MAWSPVRRFNAGLFEVDHPGDYAILNSNQSSYGTSWKLSRTQLVTIDEKLETAKQTQAVISGLSLSSSPDAGVVATLRKAKDVAAHAISIFPREAPLNDARNEMVHALYGLIRGPITQEKIDNAKGAIGVWTLRLLGSVK
jgi:hypothetical protein